MGRLSGIAVVVIGVFGSVFGIMQGIDWLTEDAEADRQRVVVQFDAVLEQRLDARLRELAVIGAQVDEADEALREDLRGAAETLRDAGEEGREALARLLEGGKTDEARALLQRLAEADAKEGAQANEQAAHRYRQIGALAFLDDTQAAMSAYEKANKLDPDNPAGWNRLGALQLRTGSLDAATQSFARALELAEELDNKEQQAAITGNLGLTYLKRGELDRAEAMFLKGLGIEEELGSKEGMASKSFILAGIFLRRGEKDKAEMLIRRAAELSMELDSE